MSELVSPSLGRVNAAGGVDGLVPGILEVRNDDKLRKNMSENAEKLGQEDRFSLSHIHQIPERTCAKILGIPWVENDG